MLKISYKKGIILFLIMIVFIRFDYLNFENKKTVVKQMNPILAKSNNKLKKEKNKENIDKNYATDRYIVKYKDDSKLKNFKNGMKSKIKYVKDKKDKKLSVITTNEKVKLEDMKLTIQKNNLDSDIEYIQPDYCMQLSSTDSLYGEQWSIENNNLIKVENKEGSSSEYKVDGNVIPAWEQTKGEGITVAVLDSGIDITHEDLKDNIFVNTKEIPNNGIDDDGDGLIDDVNGWNFYDHTNVVHDASKLEDEIHGTHVAGIIGAANNDKGIEGIAPEVKILPIKVFSNGIAYTSEIIDAINYASKMGAKIVNCSWGTKNYSPALEDAIKSSGMLFICAAGNDGQDLDVNPVYPASFQSDNIITVGSLNKSGTYSLFSNYGELSVDIAAPGEDILSTIPGNKYDKNNGTSMAAALISGEAALIFSKNTDETAGEVKEGIINSGERLSSLVGKVSKAKKMNCGNAINDIYPDISDIKKVHGTVSNFLPSDNLSKGDGYALYSNPIPPVTNYNNLQTLYVDSSVNGKVTTPILYQFTVDNSGTYDIQLDGAGVNANLLSSNKEVINSVEGSNILVSSLEANKTYYLSVYKRITLGNGTSSLPYSIKLYKGTRSEVEISRGYMDKDAMIYSPNGEYNIDFKTVEGGIYNISTKGDLGIYGYIYDSNDILVAYNDTGNDQNFVISCNLNANSIYKIKVRNLSNNVTGYSNIKLQIRYQDGDNFFETAKDISNISNIALIESRVSYPTDEDYYKFTPKSGGDYVISTYINEPNICIYVYDNNKNLITKEESNFINKNSIHLNLSADNNYYIKIVDINSDNAGNYNFSISPVISFETIQNSFTLNLTGDNISIPSKCLFNIEYNPQELEVTDLYGLSNKLDSNSINAESANVKLEGFDSGKICFSLNSDVNDTKLWSGLLNTVQFKSKVNYKTKITYFIQYKSSSYYSAEDLKGNIQSNGNNPNPGKGEEY